MTALAANMTPSSAWCQGGIQTSRRPAAGTYATGKRGYIGSLTLAVDGVAQPVVSGAAMAALCSTYGAGNAQLIVSARRAGVRLALVDPAGNSKVETVTVAFGATTIDVTVSLATDGGGAITSTPNTIVQSIFRHAQANDLLRVKAGGTGASAVVAAAAAAVKFIELLGIAEQEVDNSAGGSPLSLRPSVVFHLGKAGLLPAAGAAPLIHSMATLIDDQTVSLAPDSLALVAPVVHIEQDLHYVDLEEAR